MITAIKRVIIVIIGVLLQFGFAISIQLFFREHIAIIGIIYEVGNLGGNDQEMKF